MPSLATTVTVYVLRSSVTPASCEKLAVCRVDVGTTPRQLPFESVGQRGRPGSESVAVTGSPIDVPAERACAYAPRGARAIGEYGRIVGPGRVRRPDTRIRPVAGALRVRRPHLHLVGGVRPERRDRRRRIRDLRTDDLVPCGRRRLLVPVVVVGDGRAGVVRRFPAHVPGSRSRPPTPSEYQASPGPRRERP